MRAFWPLLFLVLACGDDGAGLDASSEDAGTSEGGPSDARVPSDARDAGPVPVWPGTLVDTADLPAVRGLRVARTVVHLHTPLSHDACSGSGFVDGGIAAPECLAHLRDALCALRLDAAFLTDHAPHVDEVPFEQALFFADGDTPVLDAMGNPIANHMACPSGHEVLVTAGSENDLMPIALKGHPSTDGFSGLREAYESNDAAAVARFREAGALVFVPHTESRELPLLRSLGMDGLEIYNVHANLDPNIREQFLGLDRASYTEYLVPFLGADSRLAPDLLVLTFLEPNQVSLDRFDTLLSEGFRPTAVGGADAHENVFPLELSDGERGDGFRRVISWVTNHLLVSDLSRDALVAALSAGRVLTVFEVLGTPSGFDFHAEHDGTTYEMGDTAPLGATLFVEVPEVGPSHPTDPPPAITARLLRATPDGAVEVARSDGPPIEHTVTVAGSYRVEVRMTPEHTRPYLGELADTLIREVPWIYANPIHVSE